MYQAEFTILSFPCFSQLSLPLCTPTITATHLATQTGHTEPEEPES